MYFSLTGKITHIINNHIVINVNNVCYEVLTSRPNNFKINEIYTVFTHFVIREDEQYLVGFSSLEEKDAFLTLISVNGVGPKTALNALKGASPKEIYDAISSNNIAFLRKLPGIGNKAASQIVLDLRGKIAKSNTAQYSQVRSALKGLGFKAKEIDSALEKINIINGTNEQILKEALKNIK